MFWHYKEISWIFDAIIICGDSAYTQLWYAWVVIGMQDCIFICGLCQAHLHWYAERAFLHFNDIKLPSIYFLIFLYSHVWLPFLFNFAIITDLTLWKWKTFDFITSNSSVASLFLYHHQTWHELLFLFLHHLTPTCSILNSSCHMLDTILAYLCCSITVVTGIFSVSGIGLLSMLFLTALNPLLSFVACMNGFWCLCTLTFLA